MIMFILHYILIKHTDMDHFKTKCFIVLNDQPTNPNKELYSQVKTYAFKNLAVIIMLNNFYNDYRIIIKKNS